MTEKFIAAVRSGDTCAIRMLLTHELKQGPVRRAFKKMCQYAEANVDNVFDLHDGKILTNDKTLWNKELLENVLKELDNNFSKERLYYLVDVSAFIMDESKNDNINKPDSEFKKTTVEIITHAEDIHLKEKFIDAVKNNNIISIRLFLANELMLDPRGYSFKIMRDYAENNINELYESHNQESFVEDQSKWDQELLYTIRNDLDTNFSRERLGYFERLCKVVLKEKALSLKTEEKKLKTQEPHNTEPTYSGTEYESKQITTKHNQFLKRLLNEMVIKPFKEGLEGENNN